MEVLLLNTNYNLEYYSSKYNEYKTLVSELLRKSVWQWEEITRLSKENELLRSKITEIENKKAYTIKLQISKQ